MLGMECSDDPGRSNAHTHFSVIDPPHDVSRAIDREDREPPVAAIEAPAIDLHATLGATSQNLGKPLGHPFLWDHSRLAPLGPPAAGLLQFVEVFPVAHG